MLHMLLTGSLLDDLVIKAYSPIVVNAVVRTTS